MSGETIDFYPWEREAIQGAEMPDGLCLEEQLAYMALRHLSAAFRLKMVDQATATREKQKIFGECRQRLEYREFSRKLDAYHVELINSTEGARSDCLKNPTPENFRRLVLVMDGIIRPIETKEETKDGID